MSTSPINLPSLKPHRGRSHKRAMRIEIVARLEAQFIPDADIARHLGVTVQALYHIKTTPEYLAKRITLQTGILSQYDNNMLASEEAKKAELESLSTLALISAKRMLLDRTDPNHGKAVFEIMDRTKATAKISRNEHSLAPQKDMSLENSRALELLALLGGKVESLPEPQPPVYNHAEVILPNTSDADNAVVEGDPQDIISDDIMDETIENNPDVRDLLN